MRPPSPTRLGRVADALAWLSGVGAATALVLLFTLEGAPAPTAGPDLELGREIYERRCATCHGAEGQGGSGTRLAGVVGILYPEFADEVMVVTTGRNGMPAFAGDLTATEIAAVVHFTREGLG